MLPCAPLHPAPSSRRALPGMETHPVLSPLHPDGRARDLWEERLDGLLDQQPRRGAWLGPAAGAPGSPPALPAPLLLLQHTLRFVTCPRGPEMEGELQVLYLASCSWKYIVWFHNRFCKLLNSFVVFGEHRIHSSQPQQPSSPHAGTLLRATRHRTPAPRSTFLHASGISENYIALLNNLALTQPYNSEATVAAHTTPLTLTNDYAFLQCYLYPPWEPGPPPAPNKNHNPPSTAGCSPRSQSEIQLKQTLFCCHPVRKHYNTLHIGCSWRQNNSHPEGGSPWALALNNTHLW